MEFFRPTSTLRFMGIPLKTSRFMPKGMAVLVNQNFMHSTMDLTYRIPMSSIDQILGCKDITLTFNTEKEFPMATPLPKKRYTVAINGKNWPKTSYPTSCFSKADHRTPDSSHIDDAFLFQTATDAALWIADRLANVRKYDSMLDPSIYSIVEVTESYAPTRTTRTI